MGSSGINTFAVTGHGENKQITDLLPGILNQLGAESLTHLKKLASNVPSADGLDGGMEAGKDDDDDDVPDLVENFDEASKNETTVENVTDAVEKVEIAEEDKDEASENIPDPVEKAEIIVEGILLKDEASKNDTSGENVTDAVAKTEITEEDKEDASENIPDAVEKVEVTVEGTDKDEASENIADAVEKVEITEEVIDKDEASKIETNSE